MNYEDVQKVSNAAKAKSNLVNTNFFKYFIRAVMAGFFIDVAMIYSNVVGNVFSKTMPEWGKFVGALVFSIAVLLISFVGGELFTGNNMVMAFGAYDKQVSWKEAGKVWGVSYLGNFVGCAILALLFVGAGASGTADYFAGFIGNKLSIPLGQMFFRAVLCNFFVCLGVLCGMKLKSDAGRFLMIVMCISGFVVSGFEHCIANMGIFVLLSVCLCLFSCNNDNDNLPKDYAGFEHSKETVECESDKSECELKIKIVATEKTKEDRTVVLATPPPVVGQAAVVQLTEKKVIIKAGKKSATTVIKIYPKQMILKKQNVTLSCTPQWKEGGISKLTILLKRK